MTKIGIIDLGTNAVRGAVFECEKGKEPIKIYKNREVLRLGKGVYTEKKIAEEGFTLTASVLKEFAKNFKDLKVDLITAVATSAVREAKNGEAFVESIKKETGISLRVISGEQEAFYIAKGILRFEKNINHSTNTSVGIIDIGGGSTEVIISTKKPSGEKITLHSKSLKLGALRLGELFSINSNPGEHNPVAPIYDVGALRFHIRTMLNEEIVKNSWESPEQFLGSGGTIRAVARLLAGSMVDSFSIQVPDLRTLIKKMFACSLEELKKIPMMDEKRADTIIPGAVLLEELLSVFQMSSIEITTFSLREGVLAEKLEELGLDPAVQ
jgi:exopolyphosphatase / guanosine-5'-triphosphate,3'-diphosphate pyrophosphatase